MQEIETPEVLRQVPEISTSETVVKKSVKDLRREKKEIENKRDQVWGDIKKGSQQLDKVCKDLEARQKRREDFKKEKKGHRKQLKKLQEKRKELHLRAVNVLQRESKAHVAVHQLNFKILEKSLQFDHIVQANPNQQAARQRYQKEISTSEEELNSIKRDQEDVEKKLSEISNIALDFKTKTDGIDIEIEDFIVKEVKMKKYQRDLLQLIKPLDQKLADIKHNLTLAEGDQRLNHYSKKLDNSKRTHVKKSSKQKN